MEGFFTYIYSAQPKPAKSIWDLIKDILTAFICPILLLLSVIFIKEINRKPWAKWSCVALCIILAYLGIDKVCRNNHKDYINTLQHIPDTTQMGKMQKSADKSINAIEPLPFQRESPKTKVRVYRILTWIILILVLIIAGTSIMIQRRTNDLHSRLMVHHEIQNGTHIFGWMRSSGGASALKYEYFVDGQRYQSLRFIKGDWRKNRSMVNNYFPVIYDPDNPANGMLLMYREDFSYFHLPYPDSINGLGIRP